MAATRKCGIFLLPFGIVYMPLSPPTSRRALKHTRAIHIEAFARDDGLWDLEARITDTKTSEIALEVGVRPAGAALHDLSIRVTINRQFEIVDVGAASDAVPYPGHCDTIGPAYDQLIGLNLLKGFRYALLARMGGVGGCTHLSELAMVLPTAAIQAFAGEEFDPHAERDKKPFQLDGCHALRTDGAVVAKYYPRWAVEQAEVPEPH
jgi:hypothetical protein